MASTMGGCCNRPSITSNLGTRREWAQDFSTLLTKSGVDPGMIVLDLSGSGLIEEFASGTASFDRLRELGVKLCASEAMPGVTEIARLARVPLTLLRLGPTCVKSLPGSA